MMNKTTVWMLLMMGFFPGAIAGSIAQIIIHEKDKKQIDKREELLDIRIKLVAEWEMEKLKHEMKNK